MVAFSLERNRRGPSVLTGLLLSFAAALSLMPGAAAQPPSAHDTQDRHGKHAHGMHSVGEGEHKIYMYQGSSAPGGDYKRSEARYSAPALALRNRFGEAVVLDDLLAGERPIVLQFIFTSCATICPVLSAGLAQAKSRLLETAPDTRLVSISIDPTFDTPARLKAYAERFDAGAEWTFLTGKAADIRQVIVAFDALYEAGNKMYHRPYTYLRGRRSDTWLRLDGLMSASALAKEHAALLRTPAAKAAGGPP